MEKDANQNCDHVENNEVDRCFDYLPRSPTDEELVLSYLRNKILNRPLPLDIIRELNIYDYNPCQLKEKYKALFGMRECYYYFSPRMKKNNKGSRFNRVARNGLWKATGNVKEMEVNDMMMAQKKTFVFFEGMNPSNRIKTEWIMEEFCLLNQPNKMNEKWDYVLCKIHERKERKAKKKENDEEDKCGSSNSLGVKEETKNFEPSTSENNQLQNQSQLLQQPQPQHLRSCLQQQKSQQPQFEANLEGASNLEVMQPNVDDDTNDFVSYLNYILSDDI